FGVAKQEDADVALTQTGEIAGTPKYMAPEVVMGKPATPRSDVYALGAVLYLVLAGRAPFEGQNTSAIYFAQLTNDAPAPSKARGEALPADLEKVVARALSKEPADRYADAGVMADALADLGLTWRPRKAAAHVAAPASKRAAGPDDPTVTAEPAAEPQKEKAS
ncbi:MAG: protein kinase domain-containing protein, partial [Polyangiaceae bacterium]